MIELTSDMLTHVNEIDSQHRELVNRINAVTSLGFKAANKEETDKTINFLGEYIVKHFGDEEASKHAGIPNSNIIRNSTNSTSLSLKR